MKKLSLSLLACICLSSVLVGCSAGWSLSNVQKRFSDGGKARTATVSIEELQDRAMQLEQIQEYEMAEELYAEILKQDHDNQMAQKRLTAVQHLKRGMSPEPVQRPIREVMKPEQKPYQSTTIPLAELPRIIPEKEEQTVAVPDFQEPAVAVINEESTISQSPINESDELPEWIVRPDAEVELKDQHKLVQSDVDSPSPNAAMIEKYPRNNEVGTESHFTHEVGTSHIANSQFPDNSLEENEGAGVITLTSGHARSLSELQSFLTQNPGDQRAIDELIDSVANANREELWLISSLLDVLMRQSESRGLILSRLSADLKSDNPLVRERAIIIAGGFGSQAKELEPLLRDSLEDKSDQVRQAAQLAIRQMWL
ncbi:MAG: HEAT repeat domain-containing protein [Planctomycetaceae bacterium]|nr:HEAT repeat domain-containing protein [Planctomycetaceae bacterium]